MHIHTTSSSLAVFIPTPSLPSGMRAAIGSVIPFLTPTPSPSRHPSFCSTAKIKAFGRGGGAVLLLREVERGREPHTHTHTPTPTHPHTHPHTHKTCSTDIGIQCSPGQCAAHTWPRRRGQHHPRRCRPRQHHRHATSLQRPHHRALHLQLHQVHRCQSAGTRGSQTWMSPAHEDAATLLGSGTLPQPRRFLPSTLPVAPRVTAD